MPTPITVFRWRSSAARARSSAARTGREYIDLGSGIGVNIFGMDDDEWRDAVTAQLGRFQHVSNLYYSEPAAKLAQMLCERTGLKRVFFSNSGAESNECAIKAARKWAAEHKGPEYCSIITLRGSFHGRTLARWPRRGRMCSTATISRCPAASSTRSPGECEAPRAPCRRAPLRRDPL